MSAPTTTTFETFMKGLWRENPVFVIQIGLCPTLAVTNTVLNALAMGVATFSVLVMSSLLVSLLRNAIPAQVRTATSIIIIATLVTMVDYIIQAISLDIYLALGPFIQLIVVNCIILGRAEAFASRNSVHLAVLDAAGMGGGFVLALLCLGTVRELLGSGSLLGYDVFGPNFQPLAIMALPPGGFFVLGAWLLLFAWVKERGSRRKVTEAKQHVG
jgi:electron transport complex protein RnfE